jgi:AdoMet-dependent rRNA methyltransferase SPB1
VDPKEKARRRLIRAGMGAGAAGGDGADGSFDVVPGGPGGAAGRATGNKRKRAAAAESDSDASDSDDDEAGDGTAAGGDSEPDPRDANYDSDTHAELLALGRLLKKHSGAKALVDASYNRYAFDDPQLPPWLAADENRNFRPQLPITREEVDRIKSRFREISARPIHKVADARARKRRRLEASLDKAKRKAAGILEAEEYADSDRSKMKAIAKLYRGAEVKRPDSVYMVANKGGGAKAGSKGGAKKGGRTKLVDPRLKKDARAAKRTARGGSKGRGKGNGKGGKGRR